MAVPATTWTDDRGLIWVDLGDEWPGFTSVLADSVSSLSPIGETPALSTYWIDATLDRIEGSSTGRLIWGNETELVRTGESLYAKSLYELFEAEQMPLTAFRAILGMYRDAVTSAIAAGARLQLDGYAAQRNPHR
jgi:hypothetical protein